MERTNSCSSFNALFSQVSNVSSQQSVRTVEETPLNKKRLLTPVIPSNDKKKLKGKENNIIDLEVISEGKEDKEEVTSLDDMNTMKDVLEDAIAEQTNKEMDQYSKFYDAFKNDPNVDCSFKDYKFELKPGAGTFFRKYINNVPILGKLTQIVLERKKMSYYFAKINNAKYQYESKDENKKFFLKFVNDSNIIIDEKELDFYKFKFNVHHKRYLHLFYYFKEKHNYIISEIKTYSDVFNVYMNYFKNIEMY